MAGMFAHEFQHVWGLGDSQIAEKLGISSKYDLFGSVAISDKFRSDCFAKKQ